MGNPENDMSFQREQNPSERLRTYGYYMQELRKRSGLTIREVADRAGVDKNTVLRLESGQPVRRSSRSAICRVYGVLDVEPGQPTTKRLFAHAAMSIAGEARWHRVRLLDPNAPSLIDTDDLYRDPAERRRQGSLGIASQFFTRLDCDFAGSRMRAGVFEVYGSSGRSRQASGEAVVFVLSGSIRFVVGEDEYTVAEGEATSFDRTIEHSHQPGEDMRREDLPARMIYVQTD